MLAHACEGSAIDLRWLADNQQTCSREGGTTLDKLRRGTITATADPPSLTLAAGETGYVDYVLRNDSDAPVTVSLFLFCAEAQAEAIIQTRKGKPVDIEPCVGGGMCGGGSIAIPLEPGADARMRFEVAAIRQVQGDDCKPRPPERLEPGRYRIELAVDLGLPSVRVPLVVEPSRW